MSQRIFVGTRKGLFIYAAGAQGYEIAGRHFLGDPVTLVLVDPRDGHIYAALDHGHFGCKMHRSVDGGESFEECAVPSYPEPPEGWHEGEGEGDVKWSLSLVWALEAGGADRPGRLWCGTIPGGLFRSDDGADSWTLVRSLWDHPGRRKWFGGGADAPGLHSVCVHPEQSDTITVGVSCGGVWVSENAGESWDLRADGMRAEYMPPEQASDPGTQDPHCVVQCRSAPKRLWAQHHNGIFISDDASQSWREITKAGPSTFGFPVVVDPNNPDRAWFIPAIKDEKRIPVDGALVVTRTSDGGESFEVLREGLPQKDAYDLVFRHAFAIDTPGERLAFGSTTGGLWFSDNQGDAWQTLSTHLPPIYCVRFG